MPTGTCRYPHHHSGGGPSAGLPVGLLAAIGIGVLVVTRAHSAASMLHVVLVVTLAVVAVLAVAGVAVAMLVHSHRAEAYDASWSDPEPQDAVAITAEVHPLQARVDQLEQQLAERQAIAAPVTHQHLHLHGVSAGDIAVALARHNHQQAITEEN
jgi:hypothetical protein